MSVLREIEVFLRTQDMPPCRFGRAAARDPRLVRDLRNGRELRPATARRLRQFMADFAAQKGDTGNA
jgi:2,4-dienoyl-CoA reductase-like NADH-dependent reductase (Old Yellow Enzyme family)